MKTETIDATRLLELKVDACPDEFWLPIVPMICGQTLIDLELENVELVDRVESSTSPQALWRARRIGSGPVVVRLKFALDGLNCDASLFARCATPRLRPSPTLEAMASDLTRGAASEQEGLRCLLAHVAERFCYDHPDARPPVSEEGVQALVCGLTPGSCIDIHCYAVALFTAAGIEAAYVAGLYVPLECPADKILRPGHCWMAVKLSEGPVAFYDIAHYLQYQLEGEILPALNPAGGERVALQTGCDHRFVVDGREVSAERALLPCGLAEEGMLRPLVTRCGWNQAPTEARLCP